jgi:hypothetical protein
MDFEQFVYKVIPNQVKNGLTFLHKIKAPPTVEVLFVFPLKKEGMEGL